MIKKNNQSFSFAKGTTIIGAIYKGATSIYESFKNLIVSGIPPLTLSKSKGVELVDYKIYGESVQEGTPTPESPIEVDCVGSLVTDEADSNYGKYKIPVKARGKNVLPNEVNDIANWENLNDNGTIRKIYKLENLKEETNYTISVNLSKTVGVGYLYLQESNDNFVTNNTTFFVAYSAEGLRPTYSFKTKPGYEYRLWYWNGGFDTFSDLYSKFQIEKGETATEYEPYFEPLMTNIYLDDPLRKMGDYADYIQKEIKIVNGEEIITQKVVRKIATKIFKGTEQWKTLLLNDTGTGYFYVYIGKYDSVIPNVCLSTHYPQKKISTSYPKIVGFNVTNSTTYNEARMLIRPEEIPTIYSTVDLWKEFVETQYLIGSPIKSYYVLTTPTEETIELPNIPTFKGTTILEVDTTIQPSNVEVIYKGKK